MIEKLTNAQQDQRRKKLKQEYFERGITKCELNLPPIPQYPEQCWRNTALGFAHKEKRWKYIKRPLDLWTFKETVLSCNPCHMKIEQDRLLTLRIFEKLRDNITR